MAANMVRTSDGSAFRPLGVYKDPKTREFVGIKVEASGLNATIIRTNDDGFELEPKATTVIKIGAYENALALMIAEKRENDPKLSPERAREIAAKQVWYSGTMQDLPRGKSSGKGENDADDMALKVAKTLGLL